MISNLVQYLLAIFMGRLKMGDKMQGWKMTDRENAINTKYGKPKVQKLAFNFQGQMSEQI